jgi:hypothetical protein
MRIHNTAFVTMDYKCSGFDPDMFVNKVVKEASLSQLMAQEGEIVRQIQVPFHSFTYWVLRKTVRDSQIIFVPLTSACSTCQREKV